MIVLGIETSCDETAVAIVTSEKKILSNVVYSQIKQHSPFGGVVPEIAARHHLETLSPLIQQAMSEAKVDFKDLSGIAATTGPGLIGGVMVGMMMGKTLAAVHNIPFLAINHLIAHALTIRITHNIDFPYLLLLVSGGHSQILIVEGPFSYKLLGSTIDDAIGEAFDKTAKLLGFPYPGGPHIEKEALKADTKRYPLPRPLLKHISPQLKCSFSLSGLKTSLRETITRHHQDNNFIPNICASFQEAIGDILEDRCRNALNILSLSYPEIHYLVIAGGVAANQYLHHRIQRLASTYNQEVIAPPINLCTDNGAMIAWTGIEKLKMGLQDTLDIKARPRWPLTEKEY